MIFTDFHPKIAYIPQSGANLGAKTTQIAYIPQSGANLGAKQGQIAYIPRGGTHMGHILVHFGHIFIDFDNYSTKEGCFRAHFHRF